MTQWPIFLKLVSTVRPNFFDGTFRDLRLLERESLQFGVGGGGGGYACAYLIPCLSDSRLAAQQGGVRQSLRELIRN